MSVFVRRTFPAVPGDNREWTRFLQGLLYAREFTTALLGCTTEPTGTVRYTVSAGIVCMKIPQLIAESNSTLTYLDNLPSEITPNHDQQCMARIVDNGITSVGLVQIGIDTGITLFADLDEGAFTASGSKGIKTSVICYPLD
jgi:hypothetical protein